MVVVASKFYYNQRNIDLFMKSRCQLTDVSHKERQRRIKQALNEQKTFRKGSLKALNCFSTYEHYHKAKTSVICVKIERCLSWTIKKHKHLTFDTLR